MAIPTFGMYILISKNVAIMCGMYIINGVHGPEPRSSGGNTSSNSQVSALIPRPVFNGMERMCQRHGSNQNSHFPVLVRKPLCNQFIHYHISSRRVFGINRFKLCNFAVVAIECSFATIYRGSIMAGIHRWSVMQAEFMETKYNSHIHGYGTSVFGYGTSVMGMEHLSWVWCIGAVKKRRGLVELVYSKRSNCKVQSEHTLNQMYKVKYMTRYY